MKLSVLGPKGTFCDVCAQKYIESIDEEVQIIYFDFFNEVVSEVSQGKSDEAIIPIENSLDGYVQKTLDLLGREDVLIVKELSLPINFKLISDCDSLDEIEKIFVQFKANGQCLDFLEANKNKNIIETESNMISFFKWQEEKGKSAAIVPSHLEVNAKMIIPNIADSQTNFTRFVVLRKRPEKINEYKRKATIMISNGIDRPGLLFNMLQKFVKYNLNLTSIISRPDRKNLNSHNFYLDIEQADDYSQLSKCIEELEQEYKVKVIGTY